jgi:signal peptidase I
MSVGSDTPPEEPSRGEVGQQPDAALPSAGEAQQAQKRQSNIKPLVVEILQTILLTLVIFAAVRSVVQNFKVDGASMEPTLHTGQYLLINKISYFKLEGRLLQIAEDLHLTSAGSDGVFPFGGPQRGDIVVFRYPAGPDRDFIKRIIGLPGDTIQIDRGRVYVNGVLQHEDYVEAVPTYSLPAQKVPPDSYFVLGDNRPNSSDSHIWGYVPEANLIGKAWLSYWPPSEWGVVAHSGLADGQ